MTGAGATRLRRKGPAPRAAVPVHRLTEILAASETDGADREARRACTAADREQLIGVEHRPVARIRHVLADPGSARPGQPLVGRLERGSGRVVPDGQAPGHGGAPDARELVAGLHRRAARFGHPQAGPRFAVPVQHLVQVGRAELPRVSHRPAVADRDAGDIRQPVHRGRASARGQRRAHGEPGAAVPVQHEVQVRVTAAVVADGPAVARGRAAHRRQLVVSSGIRATRVRHREVPPGLPVPVLHLVDGRRASRLHPDGPAVAAPGAVDAVEVTRAGRGERGHGGRLCHCARARRANLAGRRRARARPDARGDDESAGQQNCAAGLHTYLHLRSRSRAKPASYSPLAWRGGQTAHFLAVPAQISLSTLLA